MDNNANCGVCDLPNCKKCRDVDNCKECKSKKFALVENDLEQYECIEPKDCEDPGCQKGKCDKVTGK